MLIYYSEVKCMNRKDEAYASSNFKSPCIDLGYNSVIFGNDFVVPKDTVRIIIRETVADNLVERVFLRCGNFVYAIRTRIFYPNKVTVLMHVSGVDEFTRAVRRIGEPEKNIVFARDEAMLEAINCLPGEEFYDLSDRYNLIVQDDPSTSYLDNIGSCMRYCSINFTDKNHDLDYLNLNPNYNVACSPMFSKVSLNRNSNVYNDEAPLTLFNLAFDFCMNIFKFDGDINELMRTWCKPILPCDKVIDNFTLQCANDVLINSDLRRYRNGAVGILNVKPVEQITTFDAPLLDWIRRLLQLPTIQMCFRYILPKWDYELIYEDSVDKTQSSSLISDAIQRGSKVIQALLPSGKYTDVVIDKTQDDVLVIRALGNETKLFVIDLIIASALDDGFVSIRR